MHGQRSRRAGGPTGRSVTRELLTRCLARVEPCREREWPSVPSPAHALRNDSSTTREVRPTNDPLHCPQEATITTHSRPTPLLAIRVLHNTLPCPLNQLPQVARCRTNP